MRYLKGIKFWHLMVGTGFALLLIGLVLIFLPPGIGDSEPYVIEFFEASIEGSEMGLALIVLGLSCFLIGRKDLADLRTARGIQEKLGKTSALAARMVAGQVGRVYRQHPEGPPRLATYPDLDPELVRLGLEELRNGRAEDLEPSQALEQAEAGLALLEALEEEGYLV